MDIVAILLMILAIAIATGIAHHRRKLAEQRRAIRDQRRRDQQERWNEHMSGKPPGPGHNSSLT